MRCRALVACISLLIVSVACSPQTLEDFRQEGEAISCAITNELKQIRTRDDLLLHLPKLQLLFNSLVDVIIRSYEYKELNPEATLEGFSKNGQIVCDQLRVELNRVLNMEGGREIIERAQEEAFSRLEPVQNL